MVYGIFKRKKYEGKIGGIVEIEVLDKDGRVISRTREPMRSLTNNMAYWLDVFRLGSLYFRDVNGNSVSAINLGSISEISALAPSGNDNYGILIGSSSTSFSIFQYCLQAKYSNSQFAHGETTTPEVTQSPLYSCSYYQRSFTNMTSSTLPVREVGLFAKIVAGASTYYMMLTRDVISDRNVPADGTLIVKIGIFINQAPPS